MKRVFADSFYWTALANPRDDFHEEAQSLSKALGPVRIYTTDEVLTEFLTYFSRKGPHFRTKAAELVEAVLSDPNIHVIPQTRDSFLAGLKRYRERPDKQYSLVDCVAMNAMDDEQLEEVLTHDKHFAQEGFVALFQAAVEPSKGN